MAINTVSGQDIGTRLRARLSDQEGVTFPDDELNTHLAWAVQEYSNYRPRWGTYSFNTVLGLDSYPIDPAIMAINRHDYTMLGDLTFTINNTNQNVDSIFLIGQVGDDAIRFLRDEFRGRWDNITYGQINVINQSWLQLFPIPQGSYGVNIDYSAQHLLNGMDYPSIPFQDTGIISDLMLTVCWEIEVDEMLRQGDFKAGQTALTRKAPELLTRAARLKEAVYRRLGTTSTALLG